MDNDSALILVILALFIGIVALKRLQRNANEAAQKNPLGTAEIYLAYGRKKKAIELLEQHLRTHPSDEKATELLRKTIGPRD